MNLVSEKRAFEEWANKSFYSGMANIGETWDGDRRCYTEYAHQMAWKAWIAARSTPVAV